MSRENKIAEKLMTGKSLEWEVTMVCRDLVVEALGMAQKGHDTLIQEMNGVSGLPSEVSEAAKFFQLMKVRMTGLLSGLDHFHWTGRVGGKTAGRVVAGIRWSWEIRHVDNSGILVQVIGDVGGRFMKWTDLIKMVKELNGQVNSGLTGMVKEGLPLNLSTMEVHEPEVTAEDGKVGIFANVKVQWDTLNGPVGFQDVEEAMMEAGLR